MKIDFTGGPLPLEYLALRVQHWLIHQHDFLVSAQDIEDAMNEPLPASVCAEPQASPPSGGKVYQRLAQIAVYGDVWFDISRETYEATKEQGVTRILYTSPRVVDEAMVQRAALAMFTPPISNDRMDDVRAGLQAALESWK